MKLNFSYITSVCQDLPYLSIDHRADGAAAAATTTTTTTRASEGVAIVTPSGAHGAAVAALTTNTGDIGGTAGDAISLDPFICAHCLAPFATGDWIMDFIQAFRKPRCIRRHHTFHQKCYTIATRNNNTCKLCTLATCFLGFSILG